MTHPSTSAAAVPDFIDPDMWTILLIGKNHGLVGELGSAFKNSPEWYDRIDVVRATYAATREAALKQQHALELLSLEGQAMERESALIAERDQLRAHLEMWCHDGALQTFESRERFRRESRALSAPAVGVE